ncbi:Uncharacterised protein [Moraxella atlantae]|uniref:Uncharacterized protein n=1 Tax=Faucicola atlantae TaxID=34059 RepID=A0A378Q496_9GAMM|nr:Uncharacterised protein [Moraxella atlantae]
MSLTNSNKLGVESLVNTFVPFIFLITEVTQPFKKALS